MLQTPPEPDFTWTLPQLKIFTSSLPWAGVLGMRKAEQRRKITCYGNADAKMGRGSFEDEQMRIFVENSKLLCTTQIQEKTARAGVAV